MSPQKFSSIILLSDILKLALICGGLLVFYSLNQTRTAVHLQLALRCFDFLFRDVIIEKQFSKNFNFTFVFLGAVI